MCSSAPNTDGLNAAAQLDSQTGKDALAFYENVYNQSAPDRAAASALSTKVANAQLDAMNTETELAKDAADYNRTTYQPLEKSIVSDAENFDTEGKREELAGKALGDVNSSFNSARDQGMRAAARVGMDPSDGSFVAAGRQLALSQALAGAGAENKARTDATTLGRAMKMDAASLGRGLPSQQATAAGLSINAGNSAVGNAQVPLSVAAQGAGIMQQGYGTMLNGTNAAGNLYGQQAQIQNQASLANAQEWGALGSAAGSFFGSPGFKISDKTQKERRRPMKGEVALSMARKMPVEKWAYRADSPAADGGQEHVGPMAQDVQKVAGNGTAPGGKVIDVGDLTGIALAAVKHLDAKHKKLEKRVVSLASARRTKA